LGKLRDGDSAEGVCATAGQRSEADHEEMKTRERDHVDGQLAEIRVQLAREAQAGCDAGHDGGYEMVEVTVGGVAELERPHADVVESLVINAEGLVGVLNKLVNGEGGVVWLNNRVGNLRRGNDGERRHHAVWELLTDLGDQESTHTSTSATTKGVRDLEALKAVAALGLTADHVKHLVDQLRTLSVVTLGPVVTSTRLAEDEVVRAKELTEWAGSDSVHGTRLEIDKNRARNILVAGGLTV